MALLAQVHRDWGCLLALPPQTSDIAWGSLTGASSSPAPKVQTSPDSYHQQGASLVSCYSASCHHLPMALVTHQNRNWGCLLALPPQTSNVVQVSMLGSCHSHAPKVETSADSFHSEGASLESCCSASSAQGPAFTGPQSLSTSDFQHSIWVSAGAHLPKHKHLQRALRKHVPVFQSVAGPHGPSPPFSQAHHLSGSAFLLPAATIYSRAALHHLESMLSINPLHPHYRKTKSCLGEREGLRNTIRIELY